MPFSRRFVLPLCGALAFALVFTSGNRLSRRAFKRSCSPACPNDRGAAPFPATTSEAV